LAGAGKAEKMKSSVGLAVVMRAVPITRGTDGEQPARLAVDRAFGAIHVV